MPKVVLRANGPLVAHLIDDYASELRDDGYEVEVVQAGGEEERGAVRDLVVPMLWVIVAADIYPLIKKGLASWFTRQPKSVRRLRVEIYDGASRELIDSYMLQINEEERD
jgi:hypothetical protein